jgi:phage-related tail protein
MGLNTDKAKALADQILKSPASKTTFLKGDLSDLEAKLADAKRRLAAAPASKKTAIKGEISDLQAKIRSAQRALAALHDKTIAINVVETHTSNGSSVFHEGGGYAHGGIIGAASGGPRSRMTLVGEQGPELVDLAAGSRVRTANQTRQILSGASGGSVAPIALTVLIGGTQIGEALIDPLRGEIRNRGGNVQVVLGQKGA